MGAGAQGWGRGGGWRTVRRGATDEKPTPSSTQGKCPPTNHPAPHEGPTSQTATPQHGAAVQASGRDQLGEPAPGGLAGTPQATPRNQPTGPCLFFLPPPPPLHEHAHPTPPRTRTRERTLTEPQNPTPKQACEGSKRIVSPWDSCPEAGPHHTACRGPGASPLAQRWVTVQTAPYKHHTCPDMLAAAASVSAATLALLALRKRAVSTAAAAAAVSTRWCTSATAPADRLGALRALFGSAGISAFVVPSSDAHQVWGSGVMHRRRPRWTSSPPCSTVEDARHDCRRWVCRLCARLARSGLPCVVGSMVTATVPT
jgi:hypothetical protein